MVAGIDDWYLDHARRHELSPGYSADDDVPDPVAFGEVPGREWVVPRRRSPGSSGRTGRAGSAKPSRTRSQTKNTAQVPPKPAAGARRQRNAKSGRGQHLAAWKQFALRWLRANPGAGNRELKAAVEEAGFLPLAKAEIAALRAQVSSARKAPRPQSLPHKRRKVQPPPAAVHVPPVRFCDGCGLAVTNDGRCRC